MKNLHFRAAHSYPVTFLWALRFWMETAMCLNNKDYLDLGGHSYPLQGGHYLPLEVCHPRGLLHGLQDPPQILER